MTIHKLNPQLNIKKEISLRVNKVSMALFQVNRINPQDYRASLILTIFKELHQ